MLGGLGFVFELIGEACGREGAGFGFDQGFAGAGDAFDGIACAVEVIGVEDGCELGEFEVVELAEFEGGEGGVEEVFEEGACELGGRRGEALTTCLPFGLSPGEREDGFVWFGVAVHAGIFAERRCGTRGDWGRTGSLRTGRGIGTECACGRDNCDVCLVFVCNCCILILKGGFNVRRLVN